MYMQIAKIQAKGRILSPEKVYFCYMLFFFLFPEQD